MSQFPTGLSSHEKSSRRLLSFDELRSTKGIRFSRQWLAVLIAKGRFPRPVKPGGGNVNAWFEHEIDDYLSGLAVARDSNPE